MLRTRIPTGDLGSYRRRDLRTEKLDRAQHVRVREGADADLCEKPVMPEDLVLEENLLDHFVWAADNERTAR